MISIYKPSRKLNHVVCTYVLMILELHYRYKATVAIACSLQPCVPCASKVK